MNVRTVHCYITSVSAWDVACSVGRTGAPLLTKCPWRRPWWLVVVVGRLTEGPVATADSACHPWRTEGCWLEPGKGDSVCAHASCKTLHGGPRCPGRSLSSPLQPRMQPAGAGSGLGAEEERTGAGRGWRCCWSSAGWPVVVWWGCCRPPWILLDPPPGAPTLRWWDSAGSPPHPSGCKEPMSPGLSHSSPSGKVKDGLLSSFM